MIGTFRSKIEQKKGSQAQVSQDLSSFVSEKEEIEGNISHIQEAQMIIQTVAQKTQQELQYKLSELCSLAMAAVFEDPYELKVDFVIKRGKTECNLFFERGGERFEPMFDSGGGALDIASIALRMAIWAISIPRPRNVLIIDEPFKHLDAQNIDPAGIMLKEISKKLGIQIIMISHSENLISVADKVFRVKKENGVSCVNVE